MAAKTRIAQVSINECGVNPPHWHSRHPRFEQRRRQSSPTTHRPMDPAAPSSGGRVQAVRRPRTKVCVILSESGQGTSGRTSVATKRTKPSGSGSSGVGCSTTRSAPASTQRWIPSAKAFASPVIEMSVIES
jgi:hypothetical protein